MKSRLWKTICVVLCFSVLLSFLVACSKKHNDADDVKNTLTVYMLGDSVNLPYDAYTTYEIEDDSIVMVSEEGFVSALNVGETIITVNGKDSSEKYKVIVEDTRDDEDKRFGNFADIDSSTAYIGAGINLLTSGNPSSFDCILEYRILDESKIAQFGRLESSSGENEINTLMIQGDSMESFTDNYSSQIKIGGTAKYGKMFSASIDTDFSSSASMKGATQTSYLRFFSTVSKMRLALSSNMKDINLMLDDEFKEDLFGTGTKVLKPAEVIEKYGSHLILSAMYGGRMDFTYFLSSTSTSTTKQDMADVTAALSTSIFKFSADVNGKYSSDAKSTAESKNVTIYAKSNTTGGGLVDMSSIEAMRTNYSAWLKSLENVTNYSMIGLVNSNSLLEIWSFLPDGARKNEFITYFATTASRSYNDLIKKYSKTTTASTAIEFGEYPQSVASLAVTNELNNGSGMAVGSFLAENDVLLYEGARYLKYIPTRTVNSYEKNKTYYFKFEPIRWVYSDTDSNGQKLYTTESIIDCSQWYNSQEIEFPPYDSLSIDKKIELYERYADRYTFNALKYAYYDDPEGCSNFFQYIEHHDPRIDTNLENYYNDLFYGRDKTKREKESWENSTLRKFLNNKFVKISFNTEEKNKLGLVHSYYYLNKGPSSPGSSYINYEKVREDTRVAMDYASIAPNASNSYNYRGGYEVGYWSLPIMATNFAYARGLELESSYWASRSNYVDMKYICPKDIEGDLGATVYLYKGKNYFDFVAKEVDAYCGVRPTIAFR
ncbi:MAG TPA: MAC/perforin domain-containing protein [Clostridia bacterium]|nr:MAC/perforin domain-containing protein [Clostridia bacterium]